MSPEEQIREIDQQIKKTSLMDAPGTILLGLGLYAKFAANGDAFHPLLNDPSVVNGMLALGAVICVWGAYKVITLRMKRSALKKQHNI